jgi:arylformamidase
MVHSYRTICKQWTSEPDRFIISPIQQMPELNNQGREPAMLYRGMNRAQLDAAYDNNNAVPTVDEMRINWDARSASVRQNRHSVLDQAYGDRPRQRLDLFLAENPNAPTLMFIHGGYWQRNDKERYHFIAEGPLAHGINVAVVEYTLAPDARLDEIVDEVRRSVAWLAGNLGKYGADPDGIYVSGHSAGGHLTAMMMDLGAVKGGLAISGLYDLEPIRLNDINAKLRLDADEARRNSPILHLPTKAQPLIITYGSAELPELCRQSTDYAQAWLENGLPGRLLPVDGANHFSILESLADPKGALMRALVEMVNS